MLFHKIVGCIAAVATIAIATPTNLKPRAVSGPFKLVTSSTNSAHNGLYIESYHTGAGTSDPVLTTESANSINWYLNDTQVYYLTGSNFPFGINLGYPINYATWESVFIDGGYGSQGFQINGNHLLYNGDDFGGWLACNWWHANAPQLFYVVNATGPSPIPCSCSHVKLNLDYTYTS